MKTHPLLSLCLALPLCALSCGRSPRAATEGAAPTSDASPRPRFAPRRPPLVVVLVLDQFRADYLTRFDEHLGDRGFRRLLGEGASMTGHYGHYVTYTGPGHALLLSGSYPYLNGIGANNVYQAGKRRSEAMVFDADARPLGRREARPGDDLSPRNFLGTTVGDELSLATGRRSRTVAIATKGRGAILMGGRLGKAYWMDDQTGGMTSSTYYHPETPGWVTAWNAQKVADAFFGARWERSVPPAPGGPEQGFAVTLGAGQKAPNKAFYEQLAASPQGNDLTFSFARAAIEAESLGQRGVTDLLAISLSAPDLVGHDHGPYSDQVRDLIVRTDRQIGDFLTYLDDRLGARQSLVVLTADHGATPVPEQMAALGFSAGRIRKQTLRAAIDQALVARFGGKDWVVALEDPHVFLDREAIARLRLDPTEVERVAGEAVMSVAGIGGFLTRSQLLRGEAPATEQGKALVRSYHAPRGGDLMLWTQPFYFWGKYGEHDEGTTHGTSYRYDSDVPVLISGPGVRHGRHGVREMVDLAPTLSDLLGVSAPAGSEGQVIPLAEPAAG